jgi:hypothetical protein
MIGSDRQNNPLALLSQLLLKQPEEKHYSYVKEQTKNKNSK